MNLSCLFPLLAEIPAYRQLVRSLGQGGEHQVTILDAARPYFIASLNQETNSPILVLTAQPGDARKFYDQLSIWCPGDSQPLLFPEPDVLPYEDLAPDPFLVRRRLEVLSLLNDINGGHAPIVAASAPAIIWKVLSPAKFASASHILKAGMQTNLSHLIARWIDMGYEMDSAVEVPGTVSRRGGILDIYPPNSDLPARIELEGSKIESIRLFDPSTQRSKQIISSVGIIPARETASPEDGENTLANYLPENAILVLDEPAEIEAAITEIDERASRLRGECENGSDGLTRPYLTWPELRRELRRLERRLTLTRWQAEGSGEGKYRHLLDFSSAPNLSGQLATFMEKAKEMPKESSRLVIVSCRAERLSELLEKEDVVAPPLPQIGQLPPPGSITLIHGSLEKGWIMGPDGKLVLLTDSELFGFAKQRREPPRRSISRERFLADFSHGDWVVHIQHGIARFAGLARISQDGAEREYLVLEYAAGDRLYVPSDQADRVSRYLGSGGGHPALTRLSTQEWDRLKKKVKKATEEVAQELLALYAARDVIPGLAFPPDTEWQQELEASFPYMETRDQAEAVQKVKEDMEKPRPMDRLVCGDVGYGKTEVALRAAFKAVMDGKQVAVLVPTTVLAQQHFAAFNERLAAFPIKVEVLSRFRSHKEQEGVLAALAEGTVDICIGTHRLLQNDVAFKDLGLVIIDEEQRFGVTHKERLKKMRREVDVLTLTATPIPRTLHMSLARVRDMSTMETPPEERLAIKTCISEYDEGLIRRAILMELERGGQVFFVHNRVQTISRTAREVAELVPRARMAIAHGQMPEGELEQVMLEFSRGAIDVLVCTTIIESGLDIPNANTIIINDADRLGLAQLYQLRGRVGRGSNRAYTYLLYSRGKHLTAAAGKRLQTIFEATDLGAGFHIAMKDLEIRGAGSLLGTEQSGHIASVGFDLYCQLLAEAVAELKEKGTAAPASTSAPQMPTIDLPLHAHIPEEYVPHESTRLALYRRLAKLSLPEDVEEMRGELLDRFGRMPYEVENLLYMVRMKALARGAGISSISTREGYIFLSLTDGINPAATGAISGQGIRVSSSQVKLDMRAVGNKWQDLLEDMLEKLPAAPLTQVPYRSIITTDG